MLSNLMYSLANSSLCTYPWLGRGKSHRYHIQHPSSTLQLHSTSSTWTFYPISGHRYHRGPRRHNLHRTCFTLIKALGLLKRMQNIFLSNYVSQTQLIVYQLFVSFMTVTAQLTGDRQGLFTKLATDLKFGNLLP